MTKKNTERIYLDRFLEAMGWPCELADDGEAPDFIITVAGRRVGVEVVQVFADQDADYSEKREDESNRLTWLRKLCRDYYEAGGPPLSLQGLYTSVAWETLCREVGKLDLTASRKVVQLGPRVRAAKVPRRLSVVPVRVPRTTMR